MPGRGMTGYAKKHMDGHSKEFLRTFSKMSP